MAVVASLFSLWLVLIPFTPPPVPLHFTRSQYFFIQSKDYLKLKSDVINAFRAGEAKAGNVATIEVAIEALKLAEFATRSLMRQL